MPGWGGAGREAEGGAGEVEESIFQVENIEHRKTQRQKILGIFDEMIKVCMNIKEVEEWYEYKAGDMRLSHKVIRKLLNIIK